MTITRNAIIGSIFWVIAATAYYSSTGVVKEVSDGIATICMYVVPTMWVLAFLHE